MPKQSLLLVDGDPRSLRVLEVSLRKAGFTVSTAESARAAQEKIVVAAPDLIISEIKLDDGDGFELCRRVRGTPEWQDIPFMFLTGEVGIENKIRGLELGVDEYLTKPIYIKEIVTRIHMLLQKRQRARIEERKDQRTRFVGRIADMPVVDVIQTIEVSRKSGVIHFVGERNRLAAIYFRDGKVIDAEAGPLVAEDAVYRLLTWSEGDFEVVFRTVRRREVIQIGSQALLMEGMRRLDEWTRLLEQMPPLTTHVDVNLDQLAAKLGEIPDECNRLLRLIDGKRSMMAVVDACDLGDLEALQALVQLRAQGLLLEVEAPLSDEMERPKMSLEDVVASARNEESGPLAMPEVVASSQGGSGLTPAVPIGPEAMGTVPGMMPGPVPGPVTGQMRAVSPSLSPDLMPSFDASAPSGFRPSGLRLVDEAVAAAQAIDPDAPSWPTGDLVARTITGRAKTHSSITSLQRSLSPDPPELPLHAPVPQHEVRAPIRARTEPGIGSAPPPPYVPSRDAMQMEAVQPPPEDPVVAPSAPVRARASTSTHVESRTRTPAYGARVSQSFAAVPTPYEPDEAAFSELDERVATAQVDAAGAASAGEAKVSSKRSSVRTISTAGLAPSAGAPGNGSEVHVISASRTRTSDAANATSAAAEAANAIANAAAKEAAVSEARTRTPGGPYVEALPAAAGGSGRLPAIPSDGGESGPQLLIGDSTPITTSKDAAVHRVRTVTGSLVGEPPVGGGAGMMGRPGTGSMPAIGRVATGQQRVMGEGAARTRTGSQPVLRVEGEGAPVPVIGRATTGSQPAQSTGDARTRSGSQPALRVDEEAGARKTTGQQRALVEGSGTSKMARASSVSDVSPTRRTGQVPILSEEDVAGEETSAPRTASAAGESNKTPAQPRTSTKPIQLPPGSGTSVATARKRRPSPGPVTPSSSMPAVSATPRTGLQPAGLDAASAPVALAKITTEQRAVRAPSPGVVEISQPRRETQRMITSLGAASAEVSGEVESAFESAEAQAEPQRQMVTILPRRVTREMPAMEAAVEISEELAPVAAPPRVELPPNDGKRVTRELQIEPDQELMPARKRTTGAAPSEAAAAVNDASGSKRVTRELPAEPAVSQDARATRPILTRRRVTEPGTPLGERAGDDANKSAAAGAGATTEAAKGRRTTRELPAARMLEAPEQDAALAARSGESGGGKASSKRATTAPPVGSIGAANPADDADAESLVVSEEEVGDGAMGGDAKAEAKASEADASTSDVNEKASKADASASAGSASGKATAEQKGDEAKADKKDTESQPASSGKAAAAVAPSWSGTQKTTANRLPAILFGVAAVLALLVLFVWLRGRPAKPQKKLPLPSAPSSTVGGAVPDLANPSAPSTNPAPSTTNAGGGSTPSSESTPTPVPAIAPTQPAPPPPPTPTPPSPAAPPAPAATPPVEEKADPGKEAKALLAKAKKALAEGNAEGALLAVDEALELRKTARGHLLRAQALQKMGRVEDALSAVDRSIALSDEFAEGWLSRGRVLDMLGRGGEAKAAFARFLELQPTGATADEIRKRIAQ